MKKEINPHNRLMDELVTAWIFDETQTTPDPIYNPYLDRSTEYDYLFLPGNEDFLAKWMDV